MLRIIWQFQAKAARAEEFRRVYGSKGPWAELFARSPEYLGTLFLQDVLDPHAFMVIDNWERSDSFQRFRRQFGPEYSQLDQQCLELTEQETLLGNFVDDPA
jgi:heme-degrading monooxygenase HmoA